MKTPRKRSLPPIGATFSSLHGPLPCGHPPVSEKDQGKQMCVNCWLADRQETIAAIEREFELTAVILGTPRQVWAARSIRAFKVAGVADRIEAGTATVKMLEMLNKFRTRTDATWFLHNRLYSTRSRKSAVPDAEGGDDE